MGGALPFLSPAKQPTAAPFPISTRRALEPLMAGWKQFGFSDGEAIRQEGGAVPMWRIGQGGRR
jgi:hypothetical protein